MRPHVVLNCAMTLDGFLDDASGERLRISNAADLDRVDALRATCDAIVVGAETVRRDDPRLLVQSEARVAARRGAGRSEQPLRVTLSRRGALPLDRHFFRGGATKPYVYLASDAEEEAAQRLAPAATVVRSSGADVSVDFLLDDLSRHGVKRLLVEGGTSVLTAFLAAGRVDELSVAIGPFFVGDDRAPRFVGAARIPFHKGHPLRLERVERLDDVAVLFYVAEHGREAGATGGPAAGGSRGHA